MINLNLKPSRTPRANLISTTVFHFSHKLNRQVWAESNLEWDMIILLDHDNTVVDYCEQTLPDELTDKISWTPDFVVLFSDGKKMIIECKYLVELLDTEKQAKFEKKYKKMFDVCRLYKIDFIVVTDKVIHKSSRSNNCRKYMESIEKPINEINLISHILTKMRLDPGITIKLLLGHFHGLKETLQISLDDVTKGIYFLIYHNKMSFNFDEPIDLSSQLFIRDHEDSDIESLYTWLKDPNWLEIKPKTMDLISLVDLHSYSDKSLEIASYRYKIIESILINPTNNSVKIKARENNIGTSTVWRWIKMYKESSDFRSLIPKNRLKGYNIIDFDRELMEFGYKSYLKLEKPSMARAYDIMCSKAIGSNTEVPSYSTFRRKLKKLEYEKVIMRREGRKEYENRFSQNFSKFPHQSWALQTVQIDHTPIDVLVVDSDKRKVIGRPYLTVAIDIHSRCVLGYSITFDKPSRLSIALTLLNCASKKNKTLLKVRKYYPELGDKLKEIEECLWSNVYGLPSTLHMDNGSDFRSKDIINFGLVYDIKLHYRPVKGARFGAHVERFLGTLNKRLHNLKGTTFSNLSEKRDYLSEKRAMYTIDELEAIIITELVYYHIDYHNGIKSSPLDKWNESFSLDNPLKSHGRNLPEDMNKFKFDLLPSERRTIQKSGISLYNLQYNDLILKKWILARDPMDDNKKRKFTIRYDPRDIRYIFFYDPDEKGYYKIPASEILVNRLFLNNQISLWEYRAVSISPIVKDNLDEKLRIIALQQEMEEVTENKTKSQRVSKAKRKRRKIEDDIPLENLNLSINDDLEEEEIIPNESDEEKIRMNYMGKWSVPEDG